jgi:hypothetical protein
MAHKPTLTDRDRWELEQQHAQLTEGKRGAIMQVLVALVPLAMAALEALALIKRRRDIETTLRNSPPPAPVFHLERLGDVEPPPWYPEGQDEGAADTETQNLGDEGVEHGEHAWTYVDDESAGPAATFHYRCICGYETPSTDSMDEARAAAAEHLA